MEDPTQEDRNLHEVAALGFQVEQMMKSDAFQTGVLLTKARIFEEWTRASSAAEAARLHDEVRALERLLESFKVLDEEGAVAREAIRREEEADTGL